MVFRRFSLVMLLLFAAAGFSFSETVFHLKGPLTVNSNSVDIRDVIDEEIPAGMRFPLRTGRSYSNMELCGILNLMGLKDYVLAGNSIEIKKAAEEPAPLSEENASVMDRFDPSAVSDVFYVQVLDRSSGIGELIFRKGNIAIVSKVRIVRGDREGYLVQNIGGKKFKVPAKDRSER
jgi:hypothetical protein